MTRLPSGVADAGTVLGYRIGWSAVRRLPERAAYALFDKIADVTVARGGADRLRRNYAVVRPDLSAKELAELTREGMRAYLRYYCEAFRLPDLGPDELARRVRLVGDAPVRKVLDGGGSVVCFLGHMGNWDLAGAWATVHLAPVATVAERLEPESVFKEFLDFRTGLGMTILPLTGGPAIFPQLQRLARGRILVPLLADRDLTSTGVEVTFCGQPARMAAGPAALALAEGRPLFPVSIRHERIPGTWGIVVRFHDPVPVPEAGDNREKIQRMTQACADALGDVVHESPQDWHMLQRVFVKDLDAERLAAPPGGSWGSQ